MLREGFFNFTDAHLTLIGFAIFILFFIGLIIWVLLPMRQKHFERMRNLPLEKESEHEQQ